MYSGFRPLAKRADEPRKVVGARIKESLRDALPELATALGCSPSNVIEQVLEQAWLSYKAGQETKDKPEQE